jgi:hypothetical protein
MTTGDPGADVWLGLNPFVTVYNLLSGGDSELPEEGPGKWAPPAEYPVNVPLPGSLVQAELRNALQRNGGARGMSATDVVWLQYWVPWYANSVRMLLGRPVDTRYIDAEVATMWPAVRSEFNRIATSVNAYLAKLGDGTVTPEEQAEDAAIVAGQVREGAAQVIPGETVWEQVQDTRATSAGFGTLAVLALVALVLLKR